MPPKEPPTRPTAVPHRIGRVARPIGAYSATAQSRHPRRWLPLLLVAALIAIVIAGWLIVRAADHHNDKRTSGQANTPPQSIVVYRPVLLANAAEEPTALDTDRRDSGGLRQ